MNTFIRSALLSCLLCSVACAPRGDHHDAGSEPKATPSDQAARAPRTGLPETIRRAQEEDVRPDQNLPPHAAAGSDDVEIRRGVARQVWATQLGRLYSEYLFSSATPTDNFRRVRVIVDRVFSSVLWSMNRMTGLQLMTEDLSNSGRIDPIVNDRIGQLMMSLSLRRRRLEVEAAHQVPWHLPGIAIVGLLGGSKLVRSQVGAVGKVFTTSGRFVVTLGKRSEEMSVRKAVRQIDFRSLLTSKIAEDYSVPAAVITSGLTLVTYLPYYYGLKTGDVDTASPLEKTLFYNLERLIDLSNM